MNIKRNFNTFSILAFVTMIIGFALILLTGFWLVFTIASIILGMFSLLKIKENEKGLYFSVTAITFSILLIIFFFIFLPIIQNI